MSEPLTTLFQKLGISLALGVLVGLQRERSDSVIAGLRTFPLITLLGTLAAALDRSRGASGGSWRPDSGHRRRRVGDQPPSPPADEPISA